MSFLDQIIAIAVHPNWTYWLQILSELCFQRVALSGNYEIVAISTDKNTFFNDLDYKADIGQHFHKSEKSARQRHHHKIIKTNLKTLVSISTRDPRDVKRCAKLEIWFANMEPKLNEIQKTTRKHGFLTIFFSFLTVFQSLFNIGSILAHQTSKFELNAQCLM